MKLALATYYVPSIWKQATIVPIPKANKDRHLLQNLRPISLLPSAAKLLESIMKEEIDSFVDTEKCLPDNLFGFRAKTAAIHQAANLIHQAEKARLPRTTVAFALMDVEKAYNKVCRNGLIHKLWKLKCPLWLIKILQSWLQHRSFTVRIDGSLSSPRDAEVRLPQGSPISPILFNLFLYDIPTFPDDPKTNILQFADDTAIITKGVGSDCTLRRLQIALDTILAYTDTWKIKVNHGKTAIMVMGRKQPKRDYLKIRGRINLLQNQATYLGITIDRRLNFTKHVKHRTGYAFHRHVSPDQSKQPT